MLKTVQSFFFIVFLLTIASTKKTNSFKSISKSFDEECKKFILINSRLNMPLYITNSGSGKLDVRISLDGTSADKWCITPEGYLQQQDGLYLDFNGHGKQCTTGPFGYNCSWDGVLQGSNQPDQSYFILRWKLDSAKGFKQFNRVVASFTENFDGYLCSTKTGYVSMCDLNPMDKNQLWIVDYNIKKFIT